MVMINIMQWNCRELMEKTAELSNIIPNYDIVCLGNLFKWRRKLKFI